MGRPSSFTQLYDTDIQVIPPPFRASAAFGADEIIVNYNGSQLTFSNLQTVTGPIIGWPYPTTTTGYNRGVSGATFSYLLSTNATIKSYVSTAKSIFVGDPNGAPAGIFTGGGVDTIVFHKASTSYIVNGSDIRDGALPSIFPDWATATAAGYYGYAAEVTGGVQAIQFPDRTFFVASTTPLDAVDPNSKAGILAAATNTPIQSSGISTASIVELYAAALNRIPDASGLATWTMRSDREAFIAYKMGTSAEVSGSESQKGSLLRRLAGR
jgi:hypothetical protein